MRPIVSLLFLFIRAGGLLGAAIVLHADIVDQIRAVVQGEIITQSDIRDAIALRALSTNNPKEVSVTASEDTVLRQIIDQKIILINRARQPNPPPVSDADVTKEIASIRAHYKDNQAFEKTMQQLGLTQARLYTLIREKLEVLKFVDATFRPQVTVSEAEIAQYYDYDFAPQARRRGVIDIPSQSEVSQQLRQVLIEKKISSALDTWLKHQREMVPVRVITEELK